ncbi:uncharacterized protein LOC105933867 isoform X2 [Fundulus heteroclitus]|nr:uncharacterized protein LOC105933867 isoform X2 [Fundulus heteroclitus]
MWKNYNSENQECLINMTSTQSNVTAGLNIKFTTAEDAGTYSCSTFPPEAHSLQIPIVVNGSQGDCKPVSTVEVKERLPGHQRQDSLPTPSALTTLSSQRLCNRDQYSSEAGDNSGLWGQMWYWMLLGKAAILLLSLASLAVKCKRG